MRWILIGDFSAAFFSLKKWQYSRQENHVSEKYSMLLIRDTEIIFFCFNCTALLWWDKNAWEDAIQFWKAVTMTFVVILFNQIKTTIKSQITVGNPVNDAFLQQVKTKKMHQNYQE